jgi:hypothetical protein
MSVAVLLGALAIAGCTADTIEGPAVTCEQTRGNVRCVLMSVGQTTVFANNPSQAAAGGHKNGVPCFTATYLIEYLGDKPFREAALRKFQVSAAGKSLPLLDNRRGSYHKAFTYENFPQFLDFPKPGVANPARALIFQHVEFDALPNLRPFDLAIAAGFDDDVPEFKFGPLRLQGGDR